jgi:hypothetical protein
MTESSPETSESFEKLTHGLTSRGLDDLFTDLGKFSDYVNHQQAFEALSIKATRAATWLSSFWSGPLPDWFVNKNIDDQKNWDALIAAKPELKEWWEETSGESAPQVYADSALLANLVMGHYRSLPSRETGEAFDRNQAVVLELLLNAQTGADTERLAQLEYVQQILETEGHVSFSAGFNKDGSIPAFTFPDPVDL